MMTEQNLQQIEMEFHLTLPDDYRKLILSSPFRPIGKDRIYWLYDDPIEVIRSTREPLNGYYEGSAWLQTHIAIGETAMGDQYVIDVCRTPSPVFCLSHETHEFEEEFSDLDAFVAYWKKEFAESTEQPVRYQSKRWWKFWQ